MCRLGSINSEGTWLPTPGPSFADCEAEPIQDNRHMIPLPMPSYRISLHYNDLRQVP